MSDRNDKIERIFNQAIEIGLKEAREAYLRGACDGNEELRKSVDELLSVHEEAGDIGFFKTGAREGDDISTLAESPLSEGPGKVIGRYKLLQKIGNESLLISRDLDTGRMATMPMPRGTIYELSFSPDGRRSFRDESIKVFPGRQLARCQGQKGCHSSLASSVMGRHRSRRIEERERAITMRMRSTREYEILTHRFSGFKWRRKWKDRIP